MEGTTVDFLIFELISDSCKINLASNKSGRVVVSKKMVIYITKKTLIMIYDI